MNAARTLADVYRDYPEKFSLDLIQRTLRTLLGFIRYTVMEKSFYETAMKLYKQLAPLLSESDKEDHLLVFAIIIQRRVGDLKEKKNEDLIPVFYQIHEMVST